MVGYNKEKLIDFISILDGFNVEDIATKQKIRASFYKIMISDIDVMITYKKEVFSFLLAMYALFLKKEHKNESKSFSSISDTVMTHELNRALYGQARLKNTLMRQSEVPAIQILSMDSIANGRMSDVISNLMIFFDDDLQELLISRPLMKYMIRKDMFLGDSFATIEEIIDAASNYDS